MDRELKIAVGWNAMPLYGAKVISNARDYYSYNFPVIRTLPKVPVVGIEDIIKDGLHTVIPGQKITWNQLGLDIPLIFIHSGWRYKHFTSLADEVRKNGGVVIGMFDNNWKGGARQLLGIVFFRLFLKRKYSAVFVPGLQGLKLAKYLGFDDDDIYQGLYCGSNKIFKNTIKITERKKTFIFVGQFIHRKAVIELLDAFKIFRRIHPEWSIRFIGQGDLERDIDGNKGVTVEPFMQSEGIMKAMNESRVLILPSYVEHWGVVVHEATLCGCGILLTSSVGSAVDLATPENAIIIKKASVKSLVEAMCKFSNMSDFEFIRMQEKSIELSKKFSMNRWLNEFRGIVRKYKP